MAVDTEAKRKSATMLLFPGYTPLIVPNGVIGSGDWQAVAWCYNGMAATALATGVVLAEIIGMIAGAGFTGMVSNAEYIGYR